MSDVRALRNLTLVVTIFLGVIGRAMSADNVVVVVLDDSGSMNQKMPNGMLRIQAAQQALASVLGQLPPETRVGVLALNSRVNGEPWVIPMGPIGQTDWKSRVSSIQANGGTMLGEFSKVAANELLKMRESDRYSNYRLLIVTDGEASDPEVLSRYLPDILSRGITLDVIGVSMASAHSLAALAHSYRSADDAETLTAAINEVFAETSGDDTSTQSDFELLQGLEDGVAEEILRSLAQVNNEPIREVTLEPEMVSRFQMPAPPPQGGGSVFGGLFCCCGMIVGLAVIGGILLNAVTKKRRR